MFRVERLKIYVLFVLCMVKLLDVVMTNNGVLGVLRIRIISLNSLPISGAFMNSLVFVGLGSNAVNVWMCS